MTREEWERKKITLTGKLTRARNAVPLAPTLAEKIERKRAVQAAQDALHTHKLNYYQFVDREIAEATV